MIKKITITIWFIILLVPLCSGCIATGKLERANIKYDDPSKEMSVTEQSTQLLPAVYAGIVKKDKKSYHLIQVYGALKGNFRYVNVYMPLSDKNGEKYRAFINETNKLVEKKENAFCIYIIQDSGEYQSFPMSLINKKTGKPFSQLLSFIEEKAHPKNGSNPLHQEKLIAVSLNVRRNWVGFVILKNKNQEWLVEENLYFLASEKNFRFQERNRTLSIMKAGYAGTVVADIVLFPFYVIHYIVSGPVK